MDCPFNRYQILVSSLNIFFFSFLIFFFFYIERVTNPQNQKPDIAAIEAFCVMLTKESEGIQIGTKLLALHIQSSNETEALQALAVSFFSIFVYIINSNLKFNYFIILLSYTYTYI